ncbi:hypothetical protein Tco_0852935 [Tanacetum coccineum]
MNYMQQLIDNPEDISDPKTAMNMALVLMANAFKLNYTRATNNTQRISSNLHNRKIAQQGNPIRYNACQHTVNQIGQNAGQNEGIQNIGNQNGLIVVLAVGNQNENIIAAQEENNGSGNNSNQIRCYNCRGEEAVMQLQAEEFDLIDDAADCEEIEEVNAICILMANLQQASTSGEQYTKLLESSMETYMVQQDDSNVILANPNMDLSGGQVEQHPTIIKETHAFYESLYNNLVIEVEKVNTINHETREANEKLTAELARYKGQEKHFKFNQEHFEELENGYK